VQRHNIEQSTLAPEPTTHKPVALRETLQLVVGPQPGGTYQKQTKDEYDKDEVPDTSYPSENLFDNDGWGKPPSANCIPLQIEDDSPLVWIPLPYLGHMAKNRQYFYYSHATLMVLRHHNLYAKDGSVEFKEYAEAMYGQLLTESQDQRFRENNYIVDKQ
jgi:hypothetical protein